jgi:protein-S-isoprenylcysteine O-methyltransferase Ste14
VSATAALIVVAIVFVVTVLSVLLAFLFAPAERDLTLVIGPLLGTLAPTIAAVALLVQVRGVQADVQQVRQDTHALTNGLLDSKIRAGVAETVRDELVDPAAADLLRTDRQTRADHHTPEPPA